jgi:hypothetical protein
MQGTYGSLRALSMGEAQKPKGWAASMGEAQKLLTPALAMLRNASPSLKL